MDDDDCGDLLTVTDRPDWVILDEIFIGIKKVPLSCDRIMTSL